MTHHALHVSEGSTEWVAIRRPLRRNTIEIQWQIRANGKHQVWKAKGRAMDTIRANAQDTRANPNSWETRLVRKRGNIGLLRALSLRIMMMMMKIKNLIFSQITICCSL